MRADRDPCEAEAETTGGPSRLTISEDAVIDVAPNQPVGIRVSPVVGEHFPAGAGLRLTRRRASKRCGNNVEADIYCFWKPEMRSGDKPLVWLADRVKSPPFSRRARLEAGILLRRLQQGDMPAMPLSRPMPGIGGGCYELRIRDGDVYWRIVVMIEEDAVVLLDVFQKKTRKTTLRAIERCKRRVKRWQRDGGQDQ